LQNYTRSTKPASKNIEMIFWRLLDIFGLILH